MREQYEFSDFLNSSLELMHWGIKKGEESEDHKYVGRVLIKKTDKGNIYRYFYDKAEYQKYLSGHTKQQSDKKSFLDEIHDIIDSITVEAKKTLDEAKKEISDAANNLINRLHKRPAKDVDADKPETVNNATANNVEEKELSDKQKQIEEYQKNEPDFLADLPEKTDTDMSDDDDQMYVNGEPEGGRWDDDAYDYAGAQAMIEFINDDPEKYADLINRFNSGEFGDPSYMDDPRNKDKFDYEKWYQTLADTLSENGYVRADTDEKFGAYDGYATNCFDCSIAYELRQRGYDVEATKNFTGHFSSEDLQEYFEDPEILSNTSTYSSGEELCSAYETFMKDYYPDGARGQLNVIWASGSGHSMIWEKVNGEIIVRDCQTNETKTLKDVLVDCDPTAGYTRVCRTDNLTIKSPKILECVEVNDKHGKRT